MNPFLLQMHQRSDGYVNHSNNFGAVNAFQPWITFLARADRLAPSRRGTATAFWELLINLFSTFHVYTLHILQENMSFLRKIKRKRERVRERFKLLLPFLTFLMHTYVGKHQGHEQKSGSKQDCYTSNRLGGMKQTIIFLYAYSDGSDGKGSLFWLTSRQSSF